MNFHVYENGTPTPGIYETFEQALLGTRHYQESESEIEIRTINNISPVKVWKFDYRCGQFVEQLSSIR